MTEQAPDPSKPEDERLQKWREDRARVAEEERRQRLEKAEIDRQARITEAKETRERQAEADAAARVEEARKLLPTADAIAAARQRLVDLARRRKRRLIMQLAAFVLAPTLLITAYMALVATPMYEARSVVMVTKAGADNGADLGGILPAFASGANLNEAFQAFEFIKSRALMQRLEEDAGVVSRFSSDAIDPVLRLREVPLLGLSHHAQFGNYVDAAINIQNGLITLYIHAPTPSETIDLSQRVIDTTADHINRLADELFSERVAQADRAVADARAQLRNAQAALTQMQIDSGEIDPRARVEGVFASIESLTQESQTLRGEIEAAEVSGTGDTVQADRLRERERLLNERIAEQRAQLVSDDPGDDPSLNALLLDYELALLEVRIGEETLSTALQSAEKARQDAALGRNFFQVVVPPTPTEHPARPNILRTALLALLIFLAGFSVAKLMLYRP
jgi:capsular polysaccharide transport system permease protein